MIRKLGPSDQDSVLEYLYQEVNFNIFSIGDIEAFGMETDFQRIYGEFDDASKLISVFLRYRDNAVYTSYNLNFNVEYLKIFDNDPFKFLSGKAELVELIEPYLKDYKKQSTYFCKATHMTKAYEPNELIKKLTRKKDIEKLYDLLMTIDEFNYKNTEKEDYVNQKLNSKKMGITLFIEKDKKFISSVATTAETTKNAMVVGVATDEKYRHQGYASMLIEALMYEYLILKDKELCLFYDNPSAGKIYMKLGFKPIGKWNMYHKIK